MGTLRGIMLGLGVGLAAALPLAAATTDSLAPKGPGKVTAPELGVSFEAPKDWYVEERHSLLRKDDGWLFRAKSARMEGYLKETWATYSLGWFTERQEPTPQANPTAFVTYVAWPQAKSLDDLMKVYKDHYSVLVEDYKLLAGPVEDKLGGRRALTMAFKGYFNEDWTKHRKPVITQISLVPADEGVLVFGFYAEEGRWPEMKPALRALRKDVKLTEAARAKGGKRLGKGNDGDYSVGNAFYGQ